MRGGHGVARLLLELRDSMEPADLEVRDVKKQAKARGAAERHRFTAWNTLPSV